MTKVKICGITNLEDARAAWELGADQLGFNFYSGSKRYVSPRGAREIIDRSGSLKHIGVFVNEPLDSLLAITDYVGLDGIQLHGDEDIDYVAEVKKRSKAFVIRAFRVSPTFYVGDALDWAIDFPLFDTHSANEYGGTGEKFDWDEFGSEIDFLFPGNAYLAGGLNAENVTTAIRKVQPYAVDVASGVESSPGKKDRKKLEAFIMNAKSA